MIRSNEYMIQNNAVHIFFNACEHIGQVNFKHLMIQ